MCRRGWPATTPPNRACDSLNPLVYDRANPIKRSFAMDEEQKKQVAVFRFGVIADFVSGTRLPRPEHRRLLMEKCARKWTIPYSHRTRLGKSTLRDLDCPLPCRRAKTRGPLSGGQKRQRQIAQHRF